MIRKPNHIPMVYLTGTPYEIGLAHGKLCKREIEENNKKFFDFYDRLKKDPQVDWLKLSSQLEENIPEEYIDEMRGISVGAEIEYDKILFINTLYTISMKNGCFAFAFINTDQQIITIPAMNRIQSDFLLMNFDSKELLFILSISDCNSIPHPNCV